MRRTPRRRPAQPRAMASVIVISESTIGFLLTRKTTYPREADGKATLEVVVFMGLQYWSLRRPAPKPSDLFPGVGTR